MTGQQGKSYAEYQAEKMGASWRGKLKTAVDAPIFQCPVLIKLMSIEISGFFHIEKQ